MRAGIVVGWLVVWLAGGVVSPAQAQAEVTFIDVPFEETFVVTLPDDWLVWVQSEYDSYEAADEAAVDLFNRVYPDSGLTTPFILPETRLLATLPTPPNDGTMRLNIDMLSLNDFAAQMHVAPGFVSAEALAQAQAESLGGRLTTTIRLNGRLAAFGQSPFNGQTLLSVTTVFPEADRIAVVSLTAPDSYFETQTALVTFALSTLRLDGEPIPGAALLALTGVEIPNNWTLPGEIVYVEATPEPTVCEVRARQGVNLRGGPGTTFPVMGSLAAGTSAVVVSQTIGADGFVWLRLESGSWVRGDVVIENGGCAALPFFEPE